MSSSLDCMIVGFTAAAAAVAAGAAPIVPSALLVPPSTKVAERRSSRAPERVELTALQLYAQGRSVHEVAIHMATTDQTAKSYIKRGRRKYRIAGVDLGTKVLLRRHAIREGWIAPE